jgi:predicted MFS family arabinose efflux permease
MSAVLATARPALVPFAAMGMLWGALAAVLPDLKDQIGVNEAELGLALLAAPVAAVAAMLAAPVMARLYGPLALPLATLVMAAAFALPGQTSGPVGFALAMAAAGAATGSLDVLMNARVAALENARNLHLMNLCHAAYSFGYAAGALGTGAARTAGWSPAEVGAAAGIAVALFAVAAWERDGRVAGLSRAEAGGSIGALPLIGGGIVLIAFLSENAAEQWSALHIERTLGGSPAEGAAGPAVLALTMGVARLVGQGIVARVDPVRLLCAGAVIAAAGALTAAAALSPAMAYAGFIVMGIGASVIAPTAFSLVGRLAAPEARARAVARATLYGYFGYFFGPPMLGFLAAAFGLRWSFVAAALALLAVLVLAPLTVRRARAA